MRLSASAAVSLPRYSRNLLIGGSVVLFHAAAIWALNNGLLRRAVEVIVPVQILSELVTPPQKVEPAPPPPVPPPPAPPPVKPRVVKKIERPPPAAPQPLAIREAPPAPAAPVGATLPQPPAPPIAAPVAPAPSPPEPPPPAPPRIELPTSSADYLQNPRPPYPAISKRLGEQGKVVVRVLIGADGLPQQAQVQQSSGYERLDQAARATAMKWRYVPGKRGGVPEAMWVNVPINFVLE